MPRAFDDLGNEELRRRESLSPYQDLFNVFSLLTCDKLFVDINEKAANNNENDPTEITITINYLHPFIFKYLSLLHLEKKLTHRI